MDTSCILITITVGLVAFLFSKYFIKVYDYWRERGVPYVGGALPFVGHTLPVLTLRQSFGDFCDGIYKAHKGRSMVGFFQFREPHLLIRDPEIVKTVLISNFANFHVNVMSVDPDLNPLVSRNPFFTDAEEWKTERSRLTLAVMSRKKLQVLFGAIKNVCIKFKKYLEERVKVSGGVFEVDTKELFSSFTGEVVASAGFGVEGDFFSNGSGPTSFRQAVTGAFEPTLVNVISQTVLFSLPILNKLLGVSFIPKSTERFFRGVVREMIRVREEDGTTRNDFLQIMIDAQKAKGKPINEFDVAASATSFFLDGYETSAITLSFFAYQVAANPHVQSKLRCEIKTVLEKYEGEVTYEAISEMTYMDQALNESMRLYPALSFLVKRCNSQCKIVGSDGIECLVDVGTVMVVSTQGLHTDPEYWENPQVYDPDRFNEDNKRNRPKTAFLPFGEGPRICVGMRFATLQIKAAMTAMLRNYDIRVSSRTKVPLTLKPTPFLTAIDGGLWIKLTPI